MQNKKYLVYQSKWSVHNLICLKCITLDMKTIRRFTHEGEAT